MAGVPLFELDDLLVDPTGGASGGVSLQIEAGRSHAIIGPPDAGLGFVSQAIVGAPEPSNRGGRILLRGDDITSWGPDMRSRAGVFTVFPGAPPIAGITTVQILAQAIGTRDGAERHVADLDAALSAWSRPLGVDRSLVARRLDDDLTRVEAVKLELLQLAVLEADVAIIDQTGPEPEDGTTLALIEGIAAVRGRRPTLGSLAITHSRRLVEQLRPDQVHIMVGGRLVASGGPELADRLETEGYGSFT